MMPNLKSSSFILPFLVTLPLCVIDNNYISLYCRCSHTYKRTDMEQKAAIIQCHSEWRGTSSVMRALVKTAVAGGAAAAAMSRTTAPHPCYCRTVP